MDLASAYVLCPLAIICPRFQISLVKMFGVMEELWSNNKDKRARLETETEDRG
jgi:hypothetical protein